MDYAGPADHKVKLKEVKRRISTSTLLEIEKKLWNMKVTFIPFIISALGTITKGLLKGLEDMEIKGQV